MEMSRPRRGLAITMWIAGGALSLVGCTHWIELTPSDADLPAAAVTIASQERLPMVLETVHLMQNGVELSTPVAIERRILGAVEDTQLFSQYFQSGYAQPVSP